MYFLYNLCITSFKGNSIYVHVNICCTILFSGPLFLPQYYTWQFNLPVLLIQYSTTWRSHAWLFQQHPNNSIAGVFAQEYNFCFSVYLAFRCPSYPFPEMQTVWCFMGKAYISLWNCFKIILLWFLYFSIQKGTILV